jgi:hypothetical protein
MAPYPQFVGGSYTAQSPIAYDARTVNWYVERSEGQSTDAALYPTPGVEAWAVSTDAPGRGGVLVHKGLAYAVVGSKFGLITSGGAFTVLGSVVVDDNPATLCTNGDGGDQIMITSGGHLYIYNLTTTAFTEPTITFTATMGAHLDGYFLALDATTSTFYISAVLDGTAWSASDFAQRSIRPDPWVSMVVLDRYIWLHGEQTSEVWYNTGSGSFPFAAHPSGLIPVGCGAPFSPKVVGGSSLMWYGATADGEGMIVQASGFTPDTVSTFSLQTAFAGYDTRSDAVGDTYQDLGHTFYILTFPTEQKTWAYDATPTLKLPPAERWTERGTWISETSSYAAWRPLFHGFAYGEHLMLDRAGGTIYRMSSDLGSDVDSRPIRRLRRPPALFNNNARIVVPEFEVFMESGLGLSTGQGSDPQIALKVSPNGGKTFGAERSRSAGARGDYEARAIWFRNGSGMRWQPEVVCTDPVPWKITGAAAHVSGLGGG